MDSEGYAIKRQELQQKMQVAITKFEEEQQADRLAIQAAKKARLAAAVGPSVGPAVGPSARPKVGLPPGMAPPPGMAGPAGPPSSSIVAQAAQAADKYESKNLNVLKEILRGRELTTAQISQQFLQRTGQGLKKVRRSCYMC